jgi:MoxR-like ATPase
MLGGKIRAALDHRYNVGFEDIRITSIHALRHRVLLNFEGEAEGIQSDQVIQQILERVPEIPADALAS